VSLSLLLLKDFNHLDNSSLIGKKWILSTYRTRNEEIIKPLKRYYHMEFYDPFRIVKIDTNCMHKTAEYTIRDKNRLYILYQTTFKNAHMQGCDEYDGSKQYKEESTIIHSVMRSGGIYSIQGSRLILTSADGKQLLFSETKNDRPLSFLELLGIHLSRKIFG
jgi:hypothetical protein